MMGEIHFEWWAILLFLAFLFIPLILSCIGIYYFTSKKFSKIALVVSATIFISLVILNLVSRRAEPLELNISLLGFPFSIFPSFLGNGTPSLIFSLIGIVLNYFAVFGLINFTHRFFSTIIHSVKGHYNDRYS